MSKLSDNKIELVDKFINELSDQYFSIHQKRGSFHIPALRTILYQAYMKGFDDGCDIENRLKESYYEA